MVGFFVSTFSLVFCFRLAYLGIRKLGLNNKQYRQLVPLCLGLTLLNIAFIVRLLDFRDRLIGVDYGFTTLFLAAWCFTKISQAVFFWKYMEYTLNPIRLTFLPERSETLCSCLKQLRPFVTPWEAASAVGVGFAAAANGGYTTTMFKFIAVAFSLPNIYHIICVWYCFSGIINDISSLLQSRVPRYVAGKENERAHLKRRLRVLRWKRGLLLGWTSINTIGLLLGVVIDMFFGLWIYFLPIMAIAFSLKSPTQLKYDRTVAVFRNGMTVFGSALEAAY